MGMLQHFKEVVYLPVGYCDHCVVSEFCSDGLQNGRRCPQVNISSHFIQANNLYNNRCIEISVHI